MHITESGFLGVIAGDLEGGGGTIKLHWKKLGSRWKEGSHLGLQGQEAVWQWAQQSSEEREKSSVHFTTKK